MPFFSTIYHPGEICPVLDTGAVVYPVLKVDSRLRGNDIGSQIPLDAFRVLSFTHKPVFFG